MMLCIMLVGNDGALLPTLLPTFVQKSVFILEYPILMWEWSPVWRTGAYVL